MDQYQQYQDAPQQQGNPYDFILNPPKPAKSKKFGGPNTMLKVLIILVVGAALFMIAAVIILNAIAPKNLTKEDLLSLAQSQTELIRVSNQGGTAVQQTTRNFATTIEYTLMTQNQQTLVLLGKNGVKAEKKELALKQNATTDQKLKSARATSTFDKVFTELIQVELTKYANEIKRLYELASNKSDRDRMSDYHQQVQLLLSQVPYTQEKIEAAGQ